MQAARIFFRTLKYRWLRRSLVLARRKIMRHGDDALKLLVLAHDVGREEGIEVANKALAAAYKDCNVLNFAINSYGLAIKHRISFDDASRLNLEIQTRRLSHGQARSQV